MPEYPDPTEHTFIGSFWDKTKGFFSLQWQDVWNKFFDIVLPISRLWRGDTIDWINSLDDPIWEKTFKYLEDSELITAEQKEFIQKFKDIPAPFNISAWLLFVGSFFLYYVGAVGDPSSRMTVQKIEAAIKSQLPPLDSLIQSAFIAPEKMQDIREQLAKYGFSDKAVDYMLLGKYRLYDIDLIRILFQRGVLDNDKMYERMRELGFTDTRIAELIQTFDVIPGPSDLFHLVGKEAFEPETITKLGLDAEFPQDQMPWLLKQGVSEYWGHKYWAAHWYQPSIQQGMAMRHRDLIDDDIMDLLFRAQELPPFWRDKIKGITYLPYARVDIRRLWKSGVIDKESEVYDNYKWQGYDHEHALKLTQFAIIDAEEEDRGLSMGQILSAYEDRLVTRESAKELIMLLRYSDEKAEFLLISKDFDIESRLLKDRIKLVMERFINRFTDKFETLRDLNLLDLPATQINLLIEQWEIKLWKDNKMPSKADLGKFFKAGLINDTIYLDEMDKLGYNNIYANLYLKLLKPVKEISANE